MITGEHGAFGEVEQRRRHEIARDRSFNLPRNFHRDSLARRPRRNLDRLLQEEIARSEQEEEQYEHLQQRSHHTLRRPEKARSQTRPCNDDRAWLRTSARHNTHLVHLLGGARHLLHRLHDLVKLVASLLERRRRRRDPSLSGRGELVHTKPKTTGKRKYQNGRCERCGKTQHSPRPANRGAQQKVELEGKKYGYEKRAAEVQRVDHREHCKNCKAQRVAHHADFDRARFRFFCHGAFSMRVTGWMPRPAPSAPERKVPACSVRPSTSRSPSEADCRRRDTCAWPRNRRTPSS